MITLLTIAVGFLLLKWIAPFLILVVLGIIGASDSPKEKESK